MARAWFNGRYFLVAILLFCIGALDGWFHNRFTLVVDFIIFIAATLGGMRALNK